MFQAKQLAESEGLLEKKFFKGMTKEEQRLQEKKILRDIVESKLDIQGGYQKPEWTDILAFQLLMLYVRHFFANINAATRSTIRLNLTLDS